MYFKYEKIPSDFLSPFIPRDWSDNTIITLVLTQGNERGGGMTPLPDLIHLNNIVGKTKGIAPGFVHQDLVLKILELGLFIFLKTATKVYLLNLNIDISSNKLSMQIFLPVSSTSMWKTEYYCWMLTELLTSSSLDVLTQSRLLWNMCMKGKIDLIIITRVNIKLIQIQIKDSVHTSPYRMDNKSSPMLTMGLANLIINRIPTLRYW